jgi:hypothetical protein
VSTMLSRAARATARPSTELSCNRCDGCLANEMCIDLESDTGCCTFWVLRCLQCGDIVDEKILRNRALSQFDAAVVVTA